MRWRDTGRELVPVLAVLLAGLAFYLLTMAPTVLWGDDAELQRIVVTGEPRITGQSSRASHLLWLSIASWVVRTQTWLPLDRAGQTALVSAVCAAVALPLVYLAAVEVCTATGESRRRLAGMAAAGALAVSHTFWLLAVRPAVYTLQMALLAAAVWAMLRWRRTLSGAYLAIAASAVAAALLNHIMILASVPGLALLAVPAQRTVLWNIWRNPATRRQVGIAAAIALVAVMMGAVLAQRSGVPLADLALAALSYRPYLPSLRDMLLVPGYLLYQFPVAMLLAVPGVRRLWHTDRWLLAGLAALYGSNVLLMLARFHPAMYVRDQYIFYLPSYMPVAVLIGTGAAVSAGGIDIPRWLRTWWHRARRLHVPPVAVMAIVLVPLAIYPVAAVVAGTLATRLAPARVLPGRDPVAFYLWPAKTGYTGARLYGIAAFEALPASAAVVADWLPYQTLRYLQTIEGYRPDVLLEQINAGNGAQLRFLLDQRGRRPLFLANDSPFPYYEMEEIRRCFQVDPAGDGGVVYRLTPRAESIAGC